MIGKVEHENAMKQTWGVNSQRCYLENLEERIEALEAMISPAVEITQIIKPEPEPVVVTPEVPEKRLDAGNTIVDTTTGKTLYEVFEEEEKKYDAKVKRKKNSAPQHIKGCGNRGFYSKKNGCDFCDNPKNH